MMSTQEQFATGLQAITPTRFVRRDFLSAHIVEVGLLLQEQFGVEHAAEPDRGCKDREGGLGSSAGWSGR